MTYFHLSKKYTVKIKMSNINSEKLDFFDGKVYSTYIMKEKILKLNDIKNKNLQTVLEIMLQTDGLSRTEIARRTGCDNTTVSRAVRELMNRGILIHGEKSGQEHGRPQQKLKFNPDGPALIGISLEAERINGVITDLRGTVRDREQIIFNKTPDKDQFLFAVEKIIRILRTKAKDNSVGMGVAVFGSYSGPDYKLEKTAALPILNGIELRPFLNSAADFQVSICDHLVSKMAFLTRMFPEFNTGSVMLVSSGSGIGSLIAEQGRFLFVKNNHSGEFGHSTSVPDGVLCGCGRRGCLETVASVRALLQNCREKLQKPDLKFDELCQMFQDDDPVITQEVNSVADYLGIAISSQLNSWPLDQLILTGRMFELGSKFQSMLEERINSLVFSSVLSGLSIHFIRLDHDNSLARGAAIFAGRSTGVLEKLLY